MPSDIAKSDKKLRAFSLVERAMDRLTGDAPIETPIEMAPRARARFAPPPRPAAAPPDAAPPDAVPPDAVPAGAARHADPGPAAALADLPAPIALPTDRLRARGLIAPGAERSKLTEQYRLIKRPLIARALAPADRGKPSPKLIMITSAVPREGKSFTALNLALSISHERDIQTVLVDADPHRGQVMDTLGQASRPGLMEYLAGEVPHLSSVLLPTERDNLWILPPGSPKGHGSELLAGPRMAELVASLEIARRPRLVLFDTPPLLASTESVMLAAHVGQVVVVVEAAKTSRRLLEQALAMVSACPEVNLLLNKAERTLHYERYGDHQAAAS